MADRLSLANALTEARIDRPAAERIATEILDAVQNNVATKTDIDRVKVDIERVNNALKTDIGRVTSTIDLLRNDMESMEQRLRAEMSLQEHRLLIRLGSLVVVVVGILFAALRYLPPPH